MGRMKTIFTDIQLALEENNFVSVIETLNNATDKEEYKKELLFDTIETLASWQREETTPRQDHGVTLDSYLEELTDNNWHTLRELIELERDLLPLDNRQVVSNALECAIGYLEWERANKEEGKLGLFEYVTRRIF